MKITKPFATAGASLAVLLQAACASSDFGGYYPSVPASQPYYGGGQPYGAPLGRSEPPACQQLARFDARHRETRAGRETSQAVGNILGGVLGGRSGDQIGRQVGRDAGDILRGGNYDAATARQRQALAAQCQAQLSAAAAQTQVCTDSSRTTTYTRERDGQVQVDRRGAETQSCRSAHPYVRP